MSNLKKVTISNEGANHPGTSVEPTHSLRFAALPSVSSFSAHRMIDNGLRNLAGRLYGWPLSNYRFTTSELILTHTTLGTSVRREYLAHFPLLKRFEYLVLHSPATHNQEHSVASSLAFVMGPFHRCLEELSITQPNDMKDMSNPHGRGPITPLTDYEALENIEASANVFLGRPEFTSKYLHPLFPPWDTHY